jgi:hypothetical protein
MLGPYRAAADSVEESGLDAAAANTLFRALFVGPFVGLNTPPYGDVHRDARAAQTSCFPQMGSFMPFSRAATARFTRERSLVRNQPRPIRQSAC